MTDNLEQLYADVLAHDRQEAQVKAAKLAAEQTEYEAKQRAEKQVREKEALDKSFLEALRNNDIAGAKAALKDGADISYLDMGFDDKKGAYNSAPYSAYYRCLDMVRAVKSADMAEFLLKDVMNMENPKHRDVAQALLSEAFFKDEKSADKFIQLTKDNNLSLDKIMKEVVGSSHDIVETSSKLAKAGAHWDELGFNSLVIRYYGEKNGHWVGRDQDIWREGDPEAAASIKKQLLVIIKSGYQLNPEDTTQYKLIRELAYDHAYENFSEQDKKLIADLRNDNIDEIRKALDGKKLPDNVEQYMDIALAEGSREQGQFYQYYKEVMHIHKLDAPRKNTFAECEQQYLEAATLDDAIRAGKFKPDGIEKIIADKFYKEFDREFGYHPNLGLAERVKKMTPECQKAVVEKMAPKLDNILKNIEIQGNHGKVKSLLSFTMKLYDVSEEETGKNALRATMLKFRTSGSNEERREKADLYKEALEGQSMYDIKKDETIKAVSQVSYTPLSSLNRQLMKHGKELDK